MYYVNYGIRPEGYVGRKYMAVLLAISVVEALMWYFEYHEINQGTLDEATGIGAVLSSLRWGLAYFRSLARHVVVFETPCPPIEIAKPSPEVSETHRPS